MAGMIYYSHSCTLYNTLQETRDMVLLTTLGFTVISPNHPTIEARCTAVRKMVAAYNERLHQERGKGHLLDASDTIMNIIFKPLVDACAALAFRATPSGRITAGVAKEIAWAYDEQKPVLELPSSLLSRVMGLAETREYLTESGAL